MDSAQKATQPLANLTSSMFEAAMDIVDMKGYGQTAYYALLATLLVFHLLFFCLENNSGLQKTSNQLWQSLSETRQYLQVGVVKHVVYWGAFWVGLYLARTQTNVYAAIQVAGPWVQVLTLLFIVNKVCLLLTAIPNKRVSADFPLSYTSYDEVVEVTAPALYMDDTEPALSPEKSKLLYVIVYWLQSVSDIVLAQTPGALAFGYAVGCAFPRS